VVENVTFVNFSQENTSSIGACADCSMYDGGYEQYFKQLSFINCTSRIQVSTYWNMFAVVIDIV